MNPQKLGVVVGRFQVPMLHKGHQYLLNYAETRSDSLLVLIGSGKGFPTPRNPLSFEVRQVMIHRKYPRATIVQIFDQPTNEGWSADLDSIVAKHFPGYEVTLYGSRDSFIPYYHGKYAVEVVEEIKSPDGTSTRNRCCKDVHNANFRKGLICAQIERASIPYPVVDVAIIRKETREVLLGQKVLDMGKWRFIGGFFDPAIDTTLEGAARREAFEETSGLEIGMPTYIGSATIDDWRYRKDKDCIISSFFTAPYIFGAPRPGDDLDALSWFAYEEVLGALAPEHQTLGKLLMRALTHSM